MRACVAAAASSCRSERRACCRCSARSRAARLQLVGERGLRDVRGLEAVLLAGAHEGLFREAVGQVVVRLPPLGKRAVLGGTFAPPLEHRLAARGAGRVLLGPLAVLATRLAPGGALLGAAGLGVQLALVLALGGVRGRQPVPLRRRRLPGWSARPAGQRCRPRPDAPRCPGRARALAPRETTSGSASGARMWSAGGSRRCRTHRRGARRSSGAQTWQSSAAPRRSGSRPGIFRGSVRASSGTRARAHSSRPPRCAARRVGAARSARGARLARRSGARRPWLGWAAGCTVWR